MGFELSRAQVPVFYELTTTPSTNTELAARATRERLPHFSVLLTRNQTAGRGRLGRNWVAPAGASLAVSVLVRPTLPGAARLELAPPGAAQWGWVPLIAGLAMVEALGGIIQNHPVGFKWPNDVLVHNRKICGILTQVLPHGSGIIVGSGINTRMGGHELPTPTATSLALIGVLVTDHREDQLLEAYLNRLRAHLSGYFAAKGDAVAARIHAETSAHCLTLGRQVRIELPDNTSYTGLARALDQHGRLVVTDKHGKATPVAAGDVTHVR